MLRDNKDPLQLAEVGFMLNLQPDLSGSRCKLGWERKADNAAQT